LHRHYRRIPIINHRRSTFSLAAKIAYRLCHGAVAKKFWRVNDVLGMVRLRRESNDHLGKDKTGPVLRAVG
jgi:hypothetical protein